MKYIIKYRWPLEEYVGNVYKINDKKNIGWNVTINKSSAILYQLATCYLIVKTAPYRYSDMRDFQILIHE